MHAALITGKQQVDLVDFDDPTPAPGGVVVDITMCGVCGTDIHAWQSGGPYPPAVCGHEWSGTVSATASDVASLSEGDAVVVAVPPACGVCASCAAGHNDFCTTVLAHATGRHPTAPRHGGFAPSIAVDAARVLRLTAELSDVQAAQLEPATITLHAVRKSGLRLGDTVVVQGCGPIGLLTMQLARVHGASKVIAVEPNTARREMALQLGADMAATPDDAGAVVREATSGLGADLVYECAGVPATVQTAVDMARRGGTMCLIGLAMGTAVIDPRIWLTKEIVVRSALAYTHEEFEMAAGLIEDGRLDVDAMHSKTVGLAALDQALSDLAAGDQGLFKVLVDPRG